jgi:hypothetical protein
MGNVIHKVDRQVYLPDGSKMVVGTFKMSTSYAAGGDALNLSNYFANAALHFLPTTTNGVSLWWNIANSPYPDSGKIVCTCSNAAGAGNAVLYEPAATTNLSLINAVMWVIGQPT